MGSLFVWARVVGSESGHDDCPTFGGIHRQTGEFLYEMSLFLYNAAQFDPLYPNTTEHEKIPVQPNVRG